MKRSIVVFLLTFLVASADVGQTKAKPVKHGSDPAAGKTFTHNGVNLYYEVYGKVEPLLVVHGNGGSILDMARQIEFFRTRYRVIAVDSRDRGHNNVVYKDEELYLDAIRSFVQRTGENSNP